VDGRRQNPQGMSATVAKISHGSRGSHGGCLVYISIIMGDTGCSPNLRFPGETWLYIRYNKFGICYSYCDGVPISIKIRRTFSHTRDNQAN